MDKVEQILSMTNLKPTERFVLLSLHLHPNLEVDNVGIAKDIGVSLPTVVSALKTLKDEKLIEVTYLADEHTSPVRKITLNL